MTVKQLRDVLHNMPADEVVVIASDPEGNEVHSVSGVERLPAVEVFDELRVMRVMGIKSKGSVVVIWPD